MEQKQLFKVRDLRQKTQFKIDDKYLNGYARILGVYSTAVYNSLARHAEFNSQKAFPSEKLIAEEHNITERTVRNAIKRLQSANLIKIEKVRSNKGQWLNNTYFLIDKSEWSEPEELKEFNSIKKKKSNKKYTCIICGNKLIEWAHLIPKTNGGKGLFKNRIPLCPNHHTLLDSGKLTKEEMKQIENFQNQRNETTYGKNDLARGIERPIQRNITTQPEELKVPLRIQIKKDTNKKDTKIAKQSFAIPNLNLLLDKFKNINPSYKQLFKNTTQRNALARLLKEHGEKKIVWVLDILPKTNKMKFAPVITTPLQLENKLGNLIAFCQKQKGNKKGITL